MIDFHTHVLPGVDDGSKDVDESLLMLKTMAEQGIKTVVATPHFYANNESVEEFIKRRNEAYELIVGKESKAPNIKLGAEVKYYNGISRLENLKKLRIEGTKFLLLEMPFQRWTESAIKEIINIANKGMITVVLAHVERYLSFQSGATIRRLFENGVLFQVNASFFRKGLFSFKAFKMLKNEQIHYIGSDCHNMKDRSPNASNAFTIIKNKFGRKFLESYLNFQNDLFRNNQLF